MSDEYYSGVADSAAPEAEIEMLRAEVEMLRGVGCLEDGDGPCGCCVKCLRVDRDELRAENERLRAELAASERDRLAGPRDSIDL